jgi:hypothetical protein
LDTNILSRIPDLKLSEKSARAYEELSKRTDVKLVTSPKTSREIRDTPNQTRASILQFLYSLFQKVPMHTAVYSGCLGGAPLGCTPLGGGMTSPIFRELMTIFDHDDAEHIFQAIKSGCNYFLTLDRKSILNKIEVNSEKLLVLCPNLVFASPEEILDLIDSE